MLDSRMLRACASFKNVLKIILNQLKKWSIIFLMIIAIFPDDYYNNCSYAKFTNLGTFDNEFFNFVLTGDAMLFTRSSPGGGHK